MFQLIPILKGGGEKEAVTIFQYLLNREKIHGINVGFKGTWILMGIGIILLSNQNPR